MLPAVVAYYKSLAIAEDSETSRTTKWLLRQLHEALGHHLNSACKHRRYGTILYRAGGDILHALSSALGAKGADVGGQCDTSSLSCDNIPLEEAIDVVGEEMNTKIHQQVGKFVSQEQFDYRTLNFDSIVTSIDPQLWKLISIMTRSKKTAGKVQDGQTLHAHTKKIRQLYSLCTLLFCTNNRCCMPVHLLLTDVIKAGGCTSETVKILNRFGAVASEDTHSRLVTCVSSQRASEIDLELTPCAFRLASLDNVDVLLSHASAYAGKPSSIWHGTSIQCVEPKPNSLLYDSEGTSTSQATSLPREGTSSSLTASLPLEGTSSSLTASLPLEGTSSSLTASLPREGTSSSLTASLPREGTSSSLTASLPREGTSSSLTASLPLEGTSSSLTASLPREGTSSSLTASLPREGTSSSLTASLP